MKILGDLEVAKKLKYWYLNLYLYLYYEKIRIVVSNNTAHHIKILSTYHLNLNYYGTKCLIYSLYFIMNTGKFCKHE